MWGILLGVLKTLFKILVPIVLMILLTAWIVGLLSGMSILEVLQSWF